MRLLPLQSGVIYGPIESRRLGRSLGLNLLPTDRKLCSFDCIYCHYGHTAIKSMSVEEEAVPSVAQVLDAVEEALRAHQELDFITFSGNGEPTLHPRFPSIVMGVSRLRDELRPDAKLAILSNSTTAHLPHVREAFGVIDAPIMKLDAGDPRTLASINRPALEVELRTIVEGLKAISNLVIQSVFVDGKVTNARGDAFEAWLSAIGEIRPAEVQIYSTDRPVAEAGVERVPPPSLERIAAEIERRTGVRASAYWATR
jgi:wyosine [tRNA(Phe)-imidazoG37] synthetase (radical SAM superfamily)